MASITTGKITDGGGTASIEYYATATYVRSGSEVTITVKCSVYGWGHYYQAFLNGTMVIDSEDTTVYKTFTYNDDSAKTYSFPMKAYVQTAAGYEGHEYTETLTINVPAYEPDPDPDPDPDPEPTVRLVNKVVVNNETVLDLTGDTVTPETLNAGVTAHNAAGEAIVGTRAPFAIANNAGAHNSIYRGKNLGSAVTSAQWAAIEAGTFEDLFIGDYWEINGVNWRIAAFDYYLFPIGTTDHHVLIVPETKLYTAGMNASSTTSGGYAGSRMRTTNLATAKTTINNAFGSDHILTFSQSLVNAVSSGVPSGISSYDCTVELMTERHVYGSPIFGACAWGSSTVPTLNTRDKTQFPLFALNPYMISTAWYWLRDIVSDICFAGVNNATAGYAGASYNGGVRPYFCIKA